MEDEECAHSDAHFREELDSIKANMAHIISWIKQTLRHLSSEGPSHWAITFTII